MPSSGSDNTLIVPRSKTHIVLLLLQFPDKLSCIKCPQVTREDVKKNAAKFIMGLILLVLQILLGQRSKSSIINPLVTDMSANIKNFLYKFND